MIGLASSAAGLACFVSTLAKLYNAKEEYPGQLTAIARQGSGSASRSMFGGFVRWEKGTKADATDSIAVQIADENVLILEIYYIIYVFYPINSCTLLFYLYIVLA